MKREKEQGSILILTIIISVLLSIAVITGLSLSTDEMKASDQYLIKKTALYTAIEGVEDVRSEIFRNPSVNKIININRLEKGYINQNQNQGEKIYITGSMEDLDKYLTDGTVPNSKVKPFNGFAAPPVPGVALGTGTSVSPVIWNVTISSMNKRGARQAFCEINAGIYSILTTGY